MKINKLFILNIIFFTSFPAFANKIFMNAIKRGDVNKVKQLISHDIGHINFKDEDGNFALNLAVEEGNEEIVRILVRSRANVRFPGHGGVTPLMAAASLGHTSIVKEVLGVLDSGRDVIYDNVNGAVITNAVIQSARANGHAAIADYLQETHDSREALLSAVLHGNEQEVQNLVDNHADVTYGDVKGTPPLMEAAKLGHLNIAKILVAAGGALTGEVISAARNNGHSKLAEYLQKVEDDRDDLATAIALGDGDGSYAYVEDLIHTNGINVNYETPTYPPVTPLMWVAELGYLKIAKVLVAAGAIPTQAMVNAAKEGGHHALAQALIAMIYNEGGLSVCIQNHAIPIEATLPLDVAHIISSYISDIPLPRRSGNQSQPLSH